MKAIVQEGYGLPDVLRLREVGMPSIDERGVLVRVHAASVNALDWHITRGLAYLVRIGGLRAAEESIPRVAADERAWTRPAKCISCSPRRPC
jgi:NADPH:quinone reductase-like Zn-dependent oxidoreductase